MKEEERKELKRQWEAVYALPKGSVTNCPVCDKEFTKHQKNQGCCCKVPCGQRYRTLMGTRKSSRATAKKVEVGYFNWPRINQ